MSAPADNHGSDPYGCGPDNRFLRFSLLFGLSGAEEAVHAGEGIRCSKSESGGGELLTFEGVRPQGGGSQCPGSP